MPHFPQADHQSITRSGCIVLRRRELSYPFKDIQNLSNHSVHLVQRSRWQFLKRGHFKVLKQPMEADEDWQGLVKTKLLSQVVPYERLRVDTQHGTQVFF